MSVVTKGGCPLEHFMGLSSVERSLLVDAVESFIDRQNEAVEAEKAKAKAEAGR